MAVKSRSTMGKRILGRIFVHSILILVALLCIVPFMVVISVSLSSEDNLYQFGYSIFPRGIDLSAYKFIFQNANQIIDAYIVTIGVAVMGTFLGLVVNSMVAYALSRSNFRYKGRLSAYIFLTMLFGGGLIPFYLVVSKVFFLQDTFWVLFIPTLASPWNILILRTFFSKIPSSLIEAAKIDGANEFYCYLRIIIPLSKPAIATIGLMSALGYWNDWWFCLIFIDNPKLFNLQYLLYRMLRSVEMMANMPQQHIPVSSLPSETVRMAMAMIAAGPMLLVFMFFQKYFVRGLTIGSIKG